MDDTTRRVPRYPSAESEPTRQLVITERSVPEHIRGWLESKTRDVVIVAARAATEVVKKCVGLARSHGFQPTYLHPGVEQEIARSKVAA